MICTSVQNKNADEILDIMEESELMEVRLDLCRLSFDDIELIFQDETPLIATCRVDEMLNKTPWKKRSAVASMCERRLLRAIENTAAYVDVEDDVPSGMMKRIQEAAERAGTRLIVSYHDFEKTGSVRDLRLKVNAIKAAYKPDVVKIVTTPHSPEDVERVMSLYDEYEPAGLVAFCMGELGRQSRIECLRRGAPFSYAALSPEETTAPGQWTAAEMRRIVYGNIRLQRMEDEILIPPASKSFAQRAIIAAALADGTSTLEGYTNCSDSDAALKVAASLGARVTLEPMLENDPWKAEEETEEATEGTAAQVAGRSAGKEASEGSAAQSKDRVTEGATAQVAGRTAGMIAVKPDGGIEITPEESSHTAEGEITVTPEGFSSAPEISRSYEVEISGIGARPGSLDIGELHVGESGLLTRLLIPLTAEISSSDVTLNGEKTLLSRPMKGATEMMSRFGVRLSGDIIPLKVRGELSGGKAVISGKYGSQLISGLLMAEAMGNCNSTIEVREPKSIPYMFITLGVMREFGVKASVEMSGPGLDAQVSDWDKCDEIRFEIPGRQRYKPASLTLETDWSAAANFLVAGAIFGRVTLDGLHMKSLQADISIMDILSLASADVMCYDIGETSMVQVGRLPLTAFEVNASNCPDLFPIISVLAAFCAGTSRISGVDRLSHKECDRGAAILHMLTQMGVGASIDGNTLVIEGKSLTQRCLTGTLLRGGEYTSCHDHRMAMALKVASLGAAGPIIIDDEECVAKSYPNFLADFRKFRSPESE